MSPQKRPVKHSLSSMKNGKHLIFLNKGVLGSVSICKTSLTLLQYKSGFTVENMAVGRTVKGWLPWSSSFLIDGWSGRVTVETRLYKSLCCILEIELTGHIDGFTCPHAERQWGVINDFWSLVWVAVWMMVTVFNHKAGGEATLVSNTLPLI